MEYMITHFSEQEHTVPQPATSIWQVLSTDPSTDYFLQQYNIEFNRLFGMTFSSYFAQGKILANQFSQMKDPSFLFKKKIISPAQVGAWLPQYNQWNCNAENISNTYDPSALSKSVLVERYLQKSLLEVAPLHFN